MGNGAVRARLRTLAALLTLGRINIGSIVSHSDSSKITRILAGFSHTVPTIVRYHVRGNGTLLTGCIDNLNHIHRISSHRTLSLCQPDSLLDNLSLLVDTAAELSLGPRNHLIRKLVSVLLQPSFPGHLRHFIQNIVLYV